MDTPTTSEDTQTTEKAFESPADEIADLLLGDEETTESDDSAEDESPAEESTEEEEVDESESTEETIDEPEVDETWGGALGIPEEAIAFDAEGNVSGVNVKVNGKTSTVSMADLIKDYQGDKSFTEKSQNLATERKTFEEARNAVAQEFQSKLENVDLVTDYLSKKLVSEFEGINWDQLRVENPAEYAAARQDYSARAQELKQAQDAIAQEKMAAQQSMTQENSVKRKAYLESQFNLMVETNPAWVDDTVRQEAMKGIQTFAGNQYGFTSQDFDTIADARVIEVLKDAKAYREGVKTATAKRKKVVPKFQKSRGKGTKRVSKLDKLTKAAKSATGSDQRDLQTSAIAELLG